MKENKIKVAINPRTYYVVNGINFHAGQTVEVSEEAANEMVTKKIGTIINEVIESEREQE
jgi:hypothetical protein